MANFRINGHGHLLPEPNQIPAFMKQQNLFWIDDAKQNMFQGNWSRPVSHPSFFLKEKLAWMEQNKIDHEVVLNLSQLYGNGLSQQTLKDVLHFQNDFNASIQHENPKKFTTGFVVNPVYLEDALKETERCVKELNLRLMCLPTHFLDVDGKWKDITDDKVTPLFELVNQYKLAIEIHPYDGEKMIQLSNKNWRFHLIWMLAQCADVYHFYTLKAMYQKYPNIRVCFAHASQLSQINFGRRKQGFEGRPDLFEGMVHPKDANGHPNIYFDTLIHDVDAFELLVKRQTYKQIVAGLDDPYPLGEMDGINEGYPGSLLDMALDQEIISEQEYNAIWKENVERWLGKPIN